MIDITRAANDNQPRWPTRPDGTALTIGEMTKEQRDVMLRAAIVRVVKDLQATFGGTITIHEGGPR